MRALNLKAGCMLLAATLLVSCAPGYDPSTGLGKNAVIDAVNIALSNNECSKAIELIDPVYESAYTDNRVRMVRAAAYACKANFNFFTLVGDMQSNIDKLVTNEVWQLITQWFPATTAATDRVVEGAEGSTDALLSALQPGQVLVPAALFKTDTYNPRSGNFSDRTGDANTYLAFISMATIGGYHNRYGNPDPTTFKKQKILPWNTATATDMTTYGCGYASALVNFADSLEGAESSVSGVLGDAISKMKTAIQTLVYNACDAGCRGLGSGSAGSVPSGCQPSNITCSGCPTALRDRTACKATITDPASCAAAGIVDVMNVSQFGWQGP